MKIMMVAGKLRAICTGRARDPSFRARLPLVRHRRQPHAAGGVELVYDPTSVSVMGLPKLKSVTVLSASSRV